MWSLCLVGLFASMLSSPTQGDLNILPEIVFEFGVDVGQVEFMTRGETSRFKKTTRVQIDLPPCQILSFVKVTISNTLYRPEVDLNRDKEEVTISFGLLQPAAATYVVMAKSVRDPDCSLEQALENLEPLN